MIGADSRPYEAIIGIVPVDDDEQAVALMNDTVFGLAASIWTADHLVELERPQCAC